MVGEVVVVFVVFGEGDLLRLFFVVVVEVEVPFGEVCLLGDALLLLCLLFFFSFFFADLPPPLIFDFDPFRCSRSFSPFSSSFPSPP